MLKGILFGKKLGTENQISEIFRSVFMDNLLLTPLTNEITRDFFIRTLTAGNSLARELLQRIDFEGGHFFSIISTSADISKIENLESGGILPDGPLEEIQISGKKYLKQKKATSALELSEFLNMSLNRKPTQLCVFEEVTLQKGDKCISHLGFDVKYFGKEVFYFLTQENCSKSQLHSLIKQTDAQWYYMNIITTCESLVKNDQLTAQDISILALNTTHIILGAYDMEGYVCLQISERYKA
jgi:hypothetical protein